ncbi:MAG: rod shape-determining protein RodA [Prevotellaceae bacterium]|jgi:rod shape determining protein RodA|nr:rod shape-determining protein RodA [Prevotellaceae bacterium]
MHENKTDFRSIDWLSIVIYALLVSFGWINIYSTQSDTFEIFDFSKKHGIQLIWIAIAMMTAIVVMIISNRFYSVFANHIYLFAIALLIFTLLTGIEVHNSKSWISLGGMRFQPSELAKFATALCLARLFGSYEFKLNSLKSWTKTILIIVSPMSLILLQKDWGSALVFTSFLFVLYRQGMSGWALTFIAFAIVLFISSLLLPLLWIILGIIFITFIIALFTYKKLPLKAALSAVILFGAGWAYKYFTESETEYDILLVAVTAATIVASIIYTLIQERKLTKLYFALFFFCSTLTVYSVDYIYDNILSTHHRNRIETMLGIKEDIRDVGYNVYQSKVAIGSGGFYGKGFLQGTQTKLSFVPEQSTDFIFCTIGEEWGFVGSFTVILLYGILLIRMVVLSERQKIVFSRVFGYCVTSIIFFHFAINIAMTIGFAPVIGIPLPFISAGGSSLWSFTLLLFVFLKLDSANRRKNYEL